MGIATTGRDNAAIKVAAMPSTGKAGKTGSRNKSGECRGKKKKKKRKQRERERRAKSVWKVARAT